VPCSSGYYKISDGGVIEFLLNLWYVCTNLNDLGPRRGECLSAPLWEPRMSLSNGEIWILAIIFPNYCHRDTRHNGGQTILYELPEVCLMSAHPKWRFVSEMLSSQIDRRDAAKPAIHLSRRSCRRQWRVTCPTPTAIRSGHLKLRSILCATEFQLLTYSLRVKLFELIKFRRSTSVFFFTLKQVVSELWKKLKRSIVYSVTSRYALPLNSANWTTTKFPENTYWFEQLKGKLIQWRQSSVINFDIRMKNFLFWRFIIDHKINLETNLH
jgi:hypothetical protein